MRYCDLHCDALTTRNAPQVTRENLRRGGCLLQCFAAFVSARENAYGETLALTERFSVLCEREGYHAALRSADLDFQKINALLTVEGGGGIGEGENAEERLEELYSRGVRMFGIVWNYPNGLAFPNFPDYDGLFTGRSSFSARERRGLTKRGRRAVEKALSLGMMLDVSHASDGALEDVLLLCKERKKPFVASHSGADSVFSCARNLTDGQLRGIADCGGVVGLDFCADFLSEEKSAEGQKAALLAHARAIVKAGGEDLLAIGSDFDGIPENAYQKNPACVPRLLEEFAREFGARAAEKFASGNFLRVFSEVCK